MFWIIVAVLIGAVYLIYNLRHLKHKAFLILFVILVLLIYVTASKALSNKNIDWKSIEGIERGSKIYFSWLSGAFSNVKTITANAAKMDWSSNASEGNEKSGDIKLVEK